MFGYTSLAKWLMNLFVKVYSVLCSKWLKAINIKRLKSVSQIKKKNQDNYIMIKRLINKSKINMT